MSVASLVWLIVWLLLPNIPSAIAHAKGLNFWRYYMMGLVVIVVAIPASILAQPDYEELAQREWDRDLARRVAAAKARIDGPQEKGVETQNLE